MTGSGRVRDHWAHGTRPGSRRVRPGRLMAFADANCQREADEWALIEWRATRLAMVPSGLDFGGPLFRQGQVGSGDVLVRTIRQVTAALSAMASAKHAAVDPGCGDGVAAEAGRALSCDGRPGAGRRGRAAAPQPRRSDADDRLREPGRGCRRGSPGSPGCTR